MEQTKPMSGSLQGKQLDGDFRQIFVLTRVNQRLRVILRKKNFTVRRPRRTNTRMGRLSKPQKSNKHKKIKFVDPFYHGERKERMYAGHNLVPTTTEQGMSRSMKDLMRRAREAKELNRKSRRQKKEILKKRMLGQLSMEGAEREFAEVPEFKRKKGERQADFMHRVDTTTTMAIKESQIEASFKTDPDPLLEEQKEKSSKKKEKLKMRKQLKKEKQKAKKEDKKDDFHQFKDKVEFGEVVHGPPSFSVRPKHATAKDKPAVKSLLLYDIIKKTSSQEDDGQAVKTLSRSAKSSKPWSKGSNKRKFLSPSQQIRMDKERQNIIDTYRQMKKTVAGTSS